jgi:hypothetical protein
MGRTPDEPPGTKRKFWATIVRVKRKCRETHVTAAEHCFHRVRYHPANSFKRLDFWVILTNHQRVLYNLAGQRDSADMAMSGLRSSNPLVLGIGAADAANSGCGIQYERGIPNTCWPR